MRVAARALAPGGRDGGMRFRMLGPLQVRDGAGWSSIAAPQQRVVLAVLLSEAGQAVPTERLVDELWGDRVPRAAVSTVQNLVMRLRQVLGRGPDGPLLTRGRAYELVVDDGDIDARLFQGLTVAARHALSERRVPAAVEQLSQALALWRGPALSDVPVGPALAAYTARLEQARLTAIEERLVRPARPRPPRRGRRRAHRPRPRTPVAGTAAGASHGGPVPVGPAGGGT